MNALLLGGRLSMEFKTIQSIDDPLFKAALALYDKQFGIDLSLSLIHISEPTRRRGIAGGVVGV